ncbi:RNA polymerase subunit sigma-70 [Marinomonas primoryensis]|jgi:RNA polymerase sigma-70 factor (ECF subfamily)|uniref:RNA polymerase sigma factor, sigma-70 family n=1 Tax=Marinomonas primoryensis TaxID=178399 RepID=A0A2Z4PMR0_9GAMM|nr:sigma-70 family RNA polymerase sigma factor [Marinomonas primoryensis]AWX98759.1 RNA polymerase subunit sigma-70 [Marinomonas primoryensis]QKK82205.1 RNA polymerase sigma factor, sigma-70 family [Marinomonas primoryensis]|tara:strand:- start:4881 stop:5456 length:576 start_codon:yes stop_codon:yes gene_type:complete
MERAKTLQPDEQRVADMFAIAQHRDQAALARLFDHYVPRVRSFCMAAQPGSNIMADDIAQEVMIRIWNKAHTYKPEAASLNTWVFTLARNARIDYLRKNSRHQSDIDPEYLWRNVIDENADPFKDAQQKRDQERIQQGLDKLPSDQKQVLAKVYLEGKTHKEAAEELSLPLGTIKSRVRLALHKLTIYVKR